MTDATGFFKMWIRCFRLLTMLFFLSGSVFLSSAKASEKQGIPGVLRYAMKYQDGVNNLAASDSSANKISVDDGNDKKIEPHHVSPARVAFMPRNELLQRIAVKEREVIQLNQKQHEVTRERERLTETLKKERKKYMEQIAQLNLRLAEASDAKKKIANTLMNAEKLQKTMPVLKPEDMNTAGIRHNYALGVMVGRDMQALLDTRKGLGLKADGRVFLAGINDTLNDRVLLTSKLLKTSLDEDEKETEVARQKVIKVEREKGKKYVSDFIKQKGVKPHSDGFWYRLDHVGDGEVITGESTRVEIVVTEVLTDGTVVEDMDAGGTSLVMTLGELPPLFRSALLMMKNHGAITLVVPPEKAYGNDGYPPKVPPGATMVYKLRVESVTLPVIGGNTTALIKDPTIVKGR